jgi:uncharacterized protein
MAPAAAPPRFLLRLLLAAAAVLTLAWLAPLAAQAPALPKLTGAVVDTADLLPPERETALERRLREFYGRTSRQLVVVTVPSLGGETVEDYGFRLGEAWKLGNRDADNGAILLVARDDRRIRIEVGDGLEPILTDGMSGLIIRRDITPRFQAEDYASGIEHGVEAILEQLSAPAEEAERRAIEAQRQQREHVRSGNEGSIGGFIFWLFILIFVIGAMARRGRRGRRYGTRRRGPWGASPVILVDDFGVGSARDWAWGRGSRGWGGGWGGGGGGWSGGGGGGFGGFSGGGGSFGGGGASGSW